MTTRLSAKTSSGTIIDHEAKGKGLDELFLSDADTAQNPFKTEFNPAVKFTKDTCARTEMDLKQNLYYSAIIVNKGELLTGATVVIEDNDMASPTTTLAPGAADAQKGALNQVAAQTPMTAAIDWAELFYDGRLIQRLSGGQLGPAGGSNYGASFDEKMAFNEVTMGAQNSLGARGPFYVPLNLFFAENDNAFELKSLPLEIRVKFNYGQFLEDGATAMTQSTFATNMHVSLTTEHVYLSTPPTKPYYMVKDRQVEYYQTSNKTCEIPLVNNGLPISKIGFEGDALQANSIVSLRTKRGKSVRFEHYFRWLQAGARMRGHGGSGYYFGEPSGEGPCGVLNIGNQEDMILEFKNLTGNGAKKLIVSTECFNLLVPSKQDDTMTLAVQVPLPMTTKGEPATV